jgi:hypothetical protein
VSVRWQSSHISTDADASPVPYNIIVHRPLQLSVFKFIEGFLGHTGTSCSCTAPLLDFREYSAMKGMSHAKTMHGVLQCTSTGHVYVGLLYRLPIHWVRYVHICTGARVSHVLPYVILQCIILEYTRVCFIHGVLVLFI